METSKILVVDDHGETLAALVRLLKTRGYEIVAATGYREALELAESQRFDLLLCDIHLSDGDGCELLPEIRLLYPIPAIAMCGYGLPEDVERYLRAGYQRHLLKPLDVQKLFAALEEVLMQPQGS